MSKNVHSNPSPVPAPTSVATPTDTTQAVAPSKTYQDFVLPATVITKIDLSRMVAEFERIDGELTTAAVRTKIGAGQSENVVLSDKLKDFMVQNQLRTTTGNERQALLRELRKLKDSVPVVHMTFASVADPESQQQLVEWLRSSVHRQAVVVIGLQPSLVAGVYLRTPNRVRDMSLRAALKGQHGALVKQLEALRAGR